MAMPPRALPAVDPQRCTGCGRCVGACPPHVLSLQVPGGQRFGRKHAVLDDTPGCTGCALCHVCCPFDAIRMVRTAGRVQPG